MSTEVSNPDYREQQLQKAREQTREEKHDHRKATTLKHRIEQNLADETVSLPVAGETVEFETFDRATSEWASLLQERVRRLDGEDYQQAFREEVDRVYHVLGTHADPEWMTAAWWQDHISIRRAIQYITSINAEADISEADIKNSPSQT